MSSVFKGGITVSIFGESHGDAIGVVVDNLPPGEALDLDEIKAFMARRAPKQSDISSTKRREADIPKILSGFYNGYTTGTPLTCVIENTDRKSADYDKMQALARPGHADHTGFVRYNGFNDIRGGGHFSGRLTAPLVFAGAVAGQIIRRRGICCGAHIYSIGDVQDTPFDAVNTTAEDILSLRTKDFPIIGDNANKMLGVIHEAAQSGDSVGGIVECCVIGIPAGIGSPMFDGLENTIASLIFAIPAVKGLEFGLGFDAASLKGSECNDPMYVDNNGQIKSRTNNNGGILGGITRGMPVIFRAAFKPTPSISKAQNTVDYKEQKDAVLKIKGRHDACIVPRAVAVVEAAANIAVLSQIK